MQIAHRFEVGRCGLDASATDARSRSAADQRRHSSRNGRSPTPPTPSATSRQRPSSSSATCAAAATNAKSDRRALISKKPAPTRRCGQTGNRIALTHSPCRSRQHRTDEEIFRRHRRRAAGRSRLDLGAERDRDQRDFGGRIGVGDRAADGAAVAGRRMTDPRQRPRQHRQRGPDQRIALGLAWRVVAPTTTALACSRMPCKLRQTQDIDQLAGRASRIASIGTSVWPPAITPRVLVAGQQRARLGERARPDIFERGGFHGRLARFRIIVASSGPRGSRRRFAAPHHEGLRPYPEEHREAVLLER